MIVCDAYTYNYQIYSNITLSDVVDGAPPSCPTTPPWSAAGRGGKQPPSGRRSRQGQCGCVLFSILFLIDWGEMCCEDISAQFFFMPFLSFQARANANKLQETQKRALACLWRSCLKFKEIIISLLQAKIHCPCPKDRWSCPNHASYILLPRWDKEQLSIQLYIFLWTGGTRPLLEHSIILLNNFFAPRAIFFLEKCANVQNEHSWHDHHWSTQSHK